MGRNILECLGDKVNILTGYAFDGAAFAYGEDLVYTQAIFAFKVILEDQIISQKIRFDFNLLFI